VVNKPNFDDSVIVFGILEQFRGLPPPRRGGRENPDDTPDYTTSYCKVCKKDTTDNRCVCHNNEDKCYPEHLRKEHRPEIESN